jgi:hypothetical protein
MGSQQSVSPVREAADTTKTNGQAEAEARQREMEAKAADLLAQESEAERLLTEARQEEESAQAAVKDAERHRTEIRKEVADMEKQIRDHGVDIKLAAPLPPAGGSLLSSFLCYDREQAEREAEEARREAEIQAGTLSGEQAAVVHLQMEAMMALNGARARLQDASKLRSEAADRLAHATETRTKFNAASSLSDATLGPVPANTAVVH